MSFSVVIRCGRDWVPGDPCRQATPLGVVDDFDQARALAARGEGWSTVDEGGRVIDRCPACTRRELEGPTARRRATDRRPVVDAGDDCTLPCCLGRLRHRNAGRHA